MSAEPDQREIIGYSIKDTDERQKWIALVKALEDCLLQGAGNSRVVFHGTSMKRAADILRTGMEVTDIRPATQFEEAEGTFWGTCRTAAAYAEDNVQERDPGSCPVLLAIFLDELVEQAAVLLPDLATLDFPLRGLTRLDEVAVADDWVENWATKTWSDSLTDLGSLVAVHGDFIPGDMIRMIRSTEDLENMLDTRSAMTPPGGR